MKPGKIVLLTQYFPPEMGAPQNRLLETAKGLQLRGWKVMVVCAMPNYPAGKIFREYRGRLIKKESLDGMEVYRCWLYASNSKKSLPRIFSMLSFSLSCLLSARQLHDFKPDYILTESPPLTLGLSGWIMARMFGARHVLNVSDLWPLSAYELGALGKGRLYAAIEKLESFLYRTSFACTGQSNQIIQHLSSKGAKRSHLYRNGVDNSRFDAIENSPVHQPRKLIYAGLLGVAQGILKICQLVDFNKSGIEFHIYGDGAERKDIEKHLHETGKKDIFLHNPVSRNEMPKLLKQHDAALIPLIKPIFGAVPSKIYEAMAAGLPVLFAGGGEGADIIAENKAGWICEPSDFAGMEIILEKISTISDERLLEMSNNCKVVAARLFDREVQVQQLHEFLSTNS